MMLVKLCRCRVVSFNPALKLGAQGFIRFTVVGHELGPIHDTDARNKGG